MSLIQFQEVTRVFQSRGSIGSLLRHRQRSVAAVDRLNLEIMAGETLGLVGESGSGKTVTGELLVKLQRPTAGVIRFDGTPLDQLQGASLRSFRRQVQMIFQDPFASLNPRYTIGRTVGESLQIHRIPGDHDQMVRSALELVELQPAERFLSRYPHELSGGERQRAAIARALVLKPRLIVADEPTSMLDASVRAGILNLFRRLKSELNLTMLFISHDLATVRYLCDRVAVMYRGRLVEAAPAGTIIQEPRHPYTQALMAAVPRLNSDGRRNTDEPEAEAPAQSQSGGCRFRNRCPLRLSACETVDPNVLPLSPAHFIACHAVLPAAERQDVIHEV